VAIWQKAFRVVSLATGTNIPIELLTPLFERLDSLLGREQSWDSTCRQWGGIDATVFEVSETDGVVDDILYRIDMRENWKSDLRSIWEVCESLGLAFVSVPGERMIMSLADVLAEAETSQAAKFAHDPRGYIDGLKGASPNAAGHFDDAME